MMSPAHINDVVWPQFPLDAGQSMVWSTLRILSWSGLIVGIVTGGVAASLSPARAGGVLTVAMTAGDLPATTGNPDQGFEGFRFVGWNLYDALINWDLSQGDTASDIKPGLATEWHVDQKSARPMRLLAAEQKW